MDGRVVTLPPSPAVQSAITLIRWLIYSEKVLKTSLVVTSKSEGDIAQERAILSSNLRALGIWMRMTFAEQELKMTPVRQHTVSLSTLADICDTTARIDASLKEAGIESPPALFNISFLFS